MLPIAFLAMLAVADQKMAMNDLPASVREAVQHETQGSTVKRLAKEVHEGKILYEAETLREGHHRDLLFDATGTLVEVEEQIAVESAPSAVKKALDARGKILKLESVTKGTRVSYEGVVERNGRKSEVVVDGDGNPVKH